VTPAVTALHNNAIRPSTVSNKNLEGWQNDSIGLRVPFRNFMIHDLVRPCRLHDFFNLFHPEILNIKSFYAFYGKLRLRAGRSKGWTLNPGRVKNFNFSMSPRPAPGSSQPPIQLVPRVFSPCVKRQGREADRSPPTPRSRKRGSIHPLLHTSSWRKA
jgi:hypothetical protein